MGACSFLDQLAAETRVTIYRFIFKGGLNSNVIKLTGPEDEAAFPTAILQTNRQVYEEAINVLYHDKTVRASVMQFQSLLGCKEFYTLARNVEFFKWTTISDEPREEGSMPLAVVVNKLHALPRTRTISFLSDGLSLSGGQPSNDDHVTVREYDLEAELGFGALKCVDIGRYVFDARFPKLKVVYTKLVKMWADAKESAWSSSSSSGGDVDGFVEASALLEKWHAPVDSTNGSI